MINPKELRIGNIIQVDGKPAIVASLDKDFLEVEPYGFDEDFETYLPDRDKTEPIELTPEILTEWCGLENTETEGVFTIGQHKNIRISVGAFVVQNSISLEWLILTLDMKYLHQLQNFFFALMGKELEIKIPEKA